MALRRWLATARSSLWFMPTLFVIGSAAAAFALLTLDRALPELPAELPLVFGGEADGARGLLSSIAGSMITVAGVTFSITVVALQLASSQFSPRVLRTFMRDRASQLVLGTFIGAYTYTILVLRTIRTEAGDIAEFVPAIAVSIAILYTLVALGTLVYFIHHIATRIQVSTIVASIADETVEQVRATWREDGDPDRAPELPADPAGSVPADASGYVQLVDEERLVEAARKARIVVRLEVRPGAWAQEGAPLFSVWPATAVRPPIVEALRRGVVLGAERSLEQDAAFGIRQLVDVAVKAISPSVNDPTTATDCIDRIGQILVAAGGRGGPPTGVRDDDGTLRLVVPRERWDDLVALAFDQPRQYGAASADIAVSLAMTLATVASVVPEDRRPALARQARLVAEGAAEVRIEDDRRRVLEAVERALAAAGAHGSS